MIGGTLFRRSAAFVSCLWGLAVLAVPTVSLASAKAAREVSVGMTGRLEQVVLPGGPLKVRPLDQLDDVLVLRIVESYVHGDSHRYVLEYYGLEPGEYDLTDYLIREDGSNADDLPAMPVTVSAILPPGQIKPHTLTSTDRPWLGGYRALLIAGGVVWVLGLLGILFVGRKDGGADGGDSTRPKSLAERLRPMVQRAMDGTLSQGEEAELERMLLTYWRQRLKLKEVKASDAIRTLRDHEEAGPLLRQLELWLHAPEGRREKVDVSELLAPYRDVQEEICTP